MVSYLNVATVFLAALSSAWRESNGFVVPPTTAGTRSSSFQRSLSTRLASFAPVSSNGDLLPGIDAIDRNNPDLLGKLEALRQLPYFRLYSVDMLASCEYLPQELFECYSQTCEIYPVEDESVCLFYWAVSLIAVE